MTASPPPRRRILKYVASSLLVLSLGLISWIGVSLYLGEPPLGTVRTTGTALIGGPFTAIDHKGQPVSQDDFHGRYMLAYFGYTFCPDVCPGELQIIGATMDLLGPRAATVTPVFFTVDPQRDTPEVMADYVPSFHDTMVGLSGSVEQMAAAAKTFRVYFAKVKNSDADGDYLMDHSSFIYLMDPEGTFVRHFNYGTSPEDIAAALKKIIP